MANASGDLTVVYLVEYILNKSMEFCGWQRAKYINNVCKAFVTLYHYNM